MKKIKKKIVPLLLLIIVIVESFYLVSQHLPRPAIPTYHNPKLSRARLECERIADHLNELYARSEFTMAENPNESFVSYLLDAVDPYYSRKPIEGDYASQLDFGLYLMLPKKITWTNPTLLAYTTRIPTSNSPYGRRVAIFWCGQDIAAVSLKSWNLEHLIATETPKSASPNVYYCYFGPLAAEENRGTEQK